MGQASTKPGPLGTKFRVIGAGMSRTGTKTLNEALTILYNGPVHDSGVQSTGGTRQQISQWMKVMDIAPKKDRSVADDKKLKQLLFSLLDGYIATMDCPAALLTPELMEVFPDAVVIATTRDPESWWRSMQYIQTMTSNWYIPFLLMWVPNIGTYGIWREKFKYMALWRYGVDMFDEQTLEAHEDHLRAVVPKEKLFWYEVKQGWEPLCKILDLPVPDQPFPHNNSKAEARNTYNQLLIAGFMAWGVVLTILWGMYWLFWGRS
ncbi:uncharacterized protein DNG_02078 [Cephalotrichum gorgonifer]|uniref:NAD dependent epimerase/dehydratase n=1 Tax=Cephalotrichum gorgonifer TaxID=2041049 RepID=A0AAE8MUJ7_9PEZI|nr:uncharacterized protein DNG_02078 [Cephalotrichum gorgonifer]